MNRNTTLETAQALLKERYRIDSKDSGAMVEFYRRCHTQLMYVCGELEAKLSEVAMLKLDLKNANLRTRKEEYNDDYV